MVSAMTLYRKHLASKAICLIAIAALLIPLHGCGTRQTDYDDGLREVPEIQSQHNDTSTHSTTTIQQEQNGMTDSNENIFQGVWLLHLYEVQINGRIYSYDSARIQEYQRQAEVTCGLEFLDNGYCGISLVGYSNYTTWKQNDMTDATLDIIFGKERQDGRRNAVATPITFDADNNMIEFFTEFPIADQASIETMHCQFIKTDTPEKTLLSDYNVEYHDINEQFYDSLPFDSRAEERILAEDVSCQIRLMGTTHDDTNETIGYLLQVVNKTDKDLILNHFVSPVFTVHGVSVTAAYMRTLPMKVVAEDTRDELFKPVTVYLAFRKADIQGDLSEVHGKMALTDLNWDAYGIYDIDL